MIDYRREDLEKSIKVDGPRKKKIICMEEMSELIKEVSKDLRGNLRRAYLIEEVSDVYICLMMLRIMLGINDDEIQKFIDYKVERQKERDALKISKSHEIQKESDEKLDKYIEYLSRTIKMHDDLCNEIASDSVKKGLMQQADDNIRLREWLLDYKRFKDQEPRMIDGDDLMISLTDWWYSSFRGAEAGESKAIHKIVDKVEESLDQFRMYCFFTRESAEE
ncbi:MAG: hypothetical protein J6M92_05995 [Oribacterium sp.]|nr:hypothetical protein [Oribacterium sp.]